MEWIFPAINLRLIMPEIILCFFAILILIVDPFLEKSKKMASAHLAWIAIALAFVANLSLWDFQEITFSDMFLVDTTPPSSSSSSWSDRSSSFSSP